MESMFDQKPDEGLEAWLARIEATNGDAMSDHQRELRAFHLRTIKLRIGVPESNGRSKKVPHRESEVLPRTSRPVVDQFRQFWTNASEAEREGIIRYMARGR